MAAATESCCKQTPIRAEGTVLGNGMCLSSVVFQDSELVVGAFHASCHFCAIGLASFLSSWLLTQPMLPNLSCCDSGASKQATEVLNVRKRTCLAKCSSGQNETCLCTATVSQLALDRQASTPVYNDKKRVAPSSCANQKRISNVQETRRTSFMHVKYTKRAKGTNGKTTTNHQFYKNTPPRASRTNSARYRPLKRLDCRCNRCASRISGSTDTEGCLTERHRSRGEPSKFSTPITRATERTCPRSLMAHRLSSRTTPTSC